MDQKKSMREENPEKVEQGIYGVAEAIGSVYGESGYDWQDAGAAALAASLRWASDWLEGIYRADEVLGDEEQSLEGFFMRKLADEIHTDIRVGWSDEADEVPVHCREGDLRS